MATPTPESWTTLQNKMNNGYKHNNTKIMPSVPYFIQKFEEDYFNEQKMDIFFQKYWHYSIYIAIFYLIFIYCFKKYMNTRKAFDLRKPLIIWSFCLSIFSIVGAYRFIFGYYVLFKSHGFKGTLCATYYYRSHPEGIWVAAFVLSKIPELFDTFFIIARKKTLIFLHWYHHATVLMYSFYLYKDRLAGGAYYGTMNFTVHAIMYSYYTLSAMKIRVPKFVNILITTLQTLQMFIGVFVTVYLYFQLDNPQCPIHSKNLLSAMLMYSTYLYLFGEFFVKTYILKRKSSKSVKKD